MDGTPPGTGLMTDQEDNQPISLPFDAPDRESAAGDADEDAVADAASADTLPAAGAVAEEPQADDAAVAVSSAPADAPTEILPHRVVEAILFSSDSPLPPQKIAQVLGVGNARDVRKHIETLNEEYAAAGMAFRVEEIAGGFQMLTLPAYNAWLTKLLRARQEAKLSQAALETLAIVAYKQPCTRADVEAIRGVAAGDLLQRLREINLVKIVGRAEDLGRPLLYGTTKRFLEVFGLPSLDDLPQVEALSAGTPAALTPRAAEQTEVASGEAAPGGTPVADIQPPAEAEPGAEAAGTEPAPESEFEQELGAPESEPEQERGTELTAAPGAVLDPNQLADAYAAAEANAPAASEASDNNEVADEAVSDQQAPRLSIVREADEPDRDDSAH
jgi:segregation and condensation protein B